MEIELTDAELEALRDLVDYGSQDWCSCCHPKLYEKFLIIRNTNWSGKWTASILPTGRALVERLEGER